MTPAPFHVEMDPIDQGPSLVKAAQIKVMHTADGTSRQIGTYRRNYAAFALSTFFPFQPQPYGQWLALYSPDYTGTRILELPSCTDLGGEESNSNGFCPVEFYVPYDHPNVQKAGHAGLFGFVAGCIWGDDSSWKVQHLDLSMASSGILVRKELFGYVSIPEGRASLKDCISLDAYRPPQHPVVSLNVTSYFDLSKGGPLNSNDVFDFL